MRIPMLRPAFSWTPLIAALLVACGEEAIAPSCTDPVELTIVPAGTIELRITGDTAHLAASVSSACGPLEDHGPVTWATADASVAVAAEGIVTARGAGATFVSARLLSFRDSVPVEVACDFDIASIELSPATVFLSSPTDSDSLRAVARTICAEPVPDPPLRWFSTDSAIVRIDSTGVATATGSGQAWLGARVGLVADSVPVLVGAGSGFTILGVGLAPRTSNDLWVHGDNAYTGSVTPGGVCGGTSGVECVSGLYVWELAGLAAPVLVDSIVLPTFVINDVKVSADGSFAVFTREGSLDGITLLDLADPSHPRVILHYDEALGDGVHNVWIERIDGRDYVFAAENRDGGLHILDVTDRAAPVPVGHYYAGTSRVHDVYVRDGLAFVSHLDAGLVILDVGNGIRGGAPGSPVEVSRIVTVGGHVHNAWYWPARSLVFVGEESGRPGAVHVVDVADLADPVETAHLQLPNETVHNFWVDETRDVLFAGWYENGLVAIDVSGDLAGDLADQDLILGIAAPAGPNGPSSIWGAQLHDDGLIYASDRNNGLWTMRFED